MTLRVYPATTAWQQARLLLLHGAGAAVDSAFFQQLIPCLTASGIEVHAANFAYMAKTLTGQRQVAPKAEKLLPELTEMIDKLSGDVTATSDHMPLWLGGKSLGGRVISLYLAGPAVAAQVVGGVVFGYPLCPPAKAKDVAKAAQTIAARSHFLQQLQRPLLICQGSRDAFGNAAALQNAGVGKAAAGFVPATVLELVLADHDFSLPKKRQTDIAADAAFTQAARAVADFICRF